MNYEELVKVCEVLGWVAGRLRELPEQREDALQAEVICERARLVVGELAVHLSKGVEPYEALRRTAAGELPLSEHQKVLTMFFPRA